MGIVLHPARPLHAPTPPPSLDFEAWYRTLEGWADLDARAAERDALGQRAATLRRNALADGFVAEARALVEEMSTLLAGINVYVNKARQAGLPLPR